MTGLQTFADFMEVALYGADGFYATRGSAGRRGDFITSAEVGPLFGAVLSRYLDAEWQRLGSPDRFTVIEAGAGPGTLARAIKAARPSCWDALEYFAVELSEQQRQRHPEWVRSLADMPTAADPGPMSLPVVGVILANELLDNLPFDLAVYDDGWRLAHAAWDGASWTEVLGDRIHPVPPVFPPRARLGARAPLQDRAAAWVTAAQSLVHEGTVLVFDYGVARTAELAMRPWREWLRTFRGHERGDHYLVDPGSQDITVDVAFDQLPQPTSMRPQAQWLQLHGINTLVQEGKWYWAANAGSPDLEAMKMRSRVSEAEALLDPDGLGGFWALEWVSS